MDTKTASLTAVEAEELGMSLLRAATTARYEAGLTEFLKDNGNGDGSRKGAITSVRQKMEARRIARS